MSYYQHVTLSTWCLWFCSCMASDCIYFTAPLGKKWGGREKCFVLSQLWENKILDFFFPLTQWDYDWLLFLALQKSSGDTHTFFSCMEKKTLFSTTRSPHMVISYENNLNHSTFLILRCYVCKWVVCQLFLYQEENFRSSVSKREYCRLTTLNFFKRWNKIHGLTEGLENYIPAGKFYGYRKNCVSEIPVS